MTDHDLPDPLLSEADEGLLAAALMLTGQGSRLARNLRQDPTRSRLLKAAAMRRNEADEALERRGLRSVRPWTPDVPLLLAHGDADFSPLSTARAHRHWPMVAIVGARSADAYGLSLTRQLAATAVDLGFVVASGGAEGCDRAAHEGALEAARPGMPPTVAVIPGGLDNPYPAVHHELFERIVCAGGCLVSADWPDQMPRRHTFIERNHVLASICDAVVVVRAELRSGSLSTAAAAQRLGRPLGAVPGAIGVSLSEGCHALLEDGASIISSPGALARFLGHARLRDPRFGSMMSEPQVRFDSNTRWPTRPAPQPAPWREPPTRGARTGSGQGVVKDARPPVAPEAKSLLAAIHADPGIDLDSLAARTNVAPPALAGLLLELEVAGRVARIAGGRYMASD